MDVNTTEDDSLEIIKAEEVGCTDRIVLEVSKTGTVVETYTIVL